ncbi:MAG: hypothetical protein OCD76_07885 [Reichenbachiella sp.]
MSEVKSHIVINADGVWVNDQAIQVSGFEGDASAKLKSIYKHLALDYPKVFKMDNLCKLGFLGIELMKTEMNFEDYQDDEIAVHFQNTSSSLETDAKHQGKINAKQPSSPAIFVYTLPNIVMGEIAIRNRWFGENLFILADQFDYPNWEKTNEVYFESKKAKAVVGGWVELFEQDFMLDLYFISGKE